MDDSVSLLADVVKGGRCTEQSDSVFDGEVVSHPHGNQRPTHRSSSASDQSFKSNQRSQHNNPNNGKQVILVYVCLCFCQHACVYVCMCVRTYVRTYVCVILCVYIYVCVHVYVCV